MEITSGNTVISFVRGDITTIPVDAVVNAANPGLRGGGGVDGAIHRAGGPSILEECRSIVAEKGPCHTGRVVVTGAGRLPARHVIHTVGPVWRGGDHGEPALLAAAYRESLMAAERLGLAAISFPSISTGAYGYPVREAARVAVRTVMRHLEQSSPLNRVLFVLFDEDTLATYQEAARALSSAEDAS